VEVTNRALRAGIGACAPGRPFKEIGLAINNVLGKNYSVSSQFCGHGIGTFFHTRPWIFHHSKITSSYSPVSRQRTTFISVENDEPGIMKPGHCFTIEVPLELIVELFCLISQQAHYHPRKEPSRMDFPWWMDCLHRGTCLLQIGWCVEMTMHIELWTECPSRAYGPHHELGSWGSDRVRWTANWIRNGKRAIHSDQCLEFVL